MKARDWLASLNKDCNFISIEVGTKAEKREVKPSSRSELQRWLDQGSVLVERRDGLPDHQRGPLPTIPQLSAALSGSASHQVAPWKPYA